jgi:hypothetical protein
MGGALKSSFDRMIIVVASRLPSSRVRISLFNRPSAYRLRDDIHRDGQSAR